MKKNLFWIILGLVQSLVTALAYKLGTHRPAIARTELHDGTIVSCGWDSLNKCVSIWEAHTNGRREWIRMEMPKLPRRPERLRGVQWNTNAVWGTNANGQKTVMVTNKGPMLILRDSTNILIERNIFIKCWTRDPGGAQ